MLFKKQSPTTSERTRRIVQSAQRNVVFSYYANNRTPRSGTDVRDMENIQAPVHQSKRIAQWRGRLPGILAGVLVLVAMLASLRLQNDVKVVPVSSGKGQVFLRPLDTYHLYARESFSSFVNGNKLTIDTAAIVANLRRQFPELTAVSVSLPIVGNQPVVYIQPATPRLLLATQDNKLYVIDSAGRALIAGNQVPALDKLQIPVVADQSGITITLGDVALPRTTVSFIDEVVRQLNDKHITPSSLILPAGANELHVRMPGVGYVVKYNVHGNAREEAGAFLALKEHLEQEHKTPQEYVDVRVEGRAYYK